MRIKCQAKIKAFTPVTSPFSLSRSHLHAGKQFIYVPSCPGPPLLMPAACCLISVCPSFSYPFLHWGASSSTSSSPSSSLSLCAIAIAIVERAGGVVTLSKCVTTYDLAMSPSPSPSLSQLAHAPITPVPLSSLAGTICESVRQLNVSLR